MPFAPALFESRNWTWRGPAGVREEVLHVDVKRSRMKLQKVCMSDVETFRMRHVEERCMSLLDVYDNFRGRHLYIVRVSRRSSSVIRSCIPRRFRDKELPTVLDLPHAYVTLICLCAFDVGWLCLCGCHCNPVSILVARSLGIAR